MIREVKLQAVEGGVSQMSSSFFDLPVAISLSLTITVNAQNRCLFLGSS